MAVPIKHRVMCQLSQARNTDVAFRRLKARCYPSRTTLVEILLVHAAVSPQHFFR